MELLTLRGAVVGIKREGESRGLSLRNVSERSGIDLSQLSKLEIDPFPYPTLSTLTRIAEAIGVKLSIHIDAT